MTEYQGKATIASGDGSVQVAVLVHMHADQGGTRARLDFAGSGPAPS